MNRFNPNAVREGNRLKREAEERPTTFGSINGASFSEPTKQLDKGNKTRMAGPGGAFALQIAQDPELAMRIAKWDQQFAQSNQGRDFNQAKIEMGAG